MNTSPLSSRGDAPGAATRPICHRLNDKYPDSGDGGSGVLPRRSTVIQLSVRNHPGTMSHVTGLFARRAFNLEAITCVPVGEGTTSTMLLLVPDEPHLEQVERHLAKLHDVLSVTHRPDLGPQFFARCIGAESSHA